ncbi:MAG TPA: hypothetical protein VN026_03855 [Bacteroidia bacterium]|jgi:hypothetical protein|nr:hypothetical protein [Bacteroidia bacterium]
MARDKTKDDIMFNCEQEYEINQVASHYGKDKSIVYSFLKQKCHGRAISHFSHLKVYKLIKEQLGYEIPV